MKPDFEH